ncbi:MAG: M20/M25/M40 family metallo-hydrolase [Cyclobacteriaceae bacterium]|nr:M20/M25/M40 family metallo-hydrolase [Cyclobacteriaceae bacterium]
MRLYAFVFLLLFSFAAAGQDPVIDAIVKEASENSQLERLAHELFDGIGPRLVGTPQMQQAHDWAIKKYADWGITARNEKWGEWKGWERGVSHIDMIYPRVKTLEAMQLAWSPSTNGKAVVGELVIIPDLDDSLAFQKWLPAVKGKFVMMSMPQPTGRPDYNWKEHGTPESFEKMKAQRTALTEAWDKRIAKTGKTTRTLPAVLEKAGALGIVTSNWSRGFGVNKIFQARTTKVPTIDVSLEDYGMLYRLQESGVKPRISVRTDSKDLGMVPTFNTIAEIKGSEKPDEYVMLSAHFDSWDGGTGATDNGTGTIMMMEALRILKKVYPNPKRTILVGHWGSEEQGLNGSRAFVEDHPDIVNNLHMLFNQDNGTGRIREITGQGFLHAYDYIQRYLSKVPEKVRNGLTTTFPGIPSGGGSDNASFTSVGAPGFGLNATSFSYFDYTWHTNRDTYDKVVFDDLRSNAILAAILVYQACEDPNKFPREKSFLPVDSKTGARANWPEPRKATRKGPVN